MSRSSTNGAPALQAYFLETSAAAAALSTERGALAPAEAPWTGRRLRHALADLGPARPNAFDSDAEPGTEATATVEATLPLPPPVRPAQKVLADLSRWHDQDAAGSQDRASALPPAVASLIAALPAQSPPLGPHEIVAALAGTGPNPVASAPNAPALPEPIRPEASERPPMIIERAHAEREFRAEATRANPTRSNPLPAMLTGFACAMATGVALYFALVLR